MHRLTAIGIMAACVGLTACSASTVNGHGAAGAPVTTPPGASSSSSTSSAPSTAPIAPGELGLIPLRRGDLPTGWEAKPASSDSSADDKKFDQDLFACVGTSGSHGQEVDSVDGLEFTQGESRISSSVTKYATQSAVDKDVAVLTNPKFETCLERVFRDLLESSAPADGSVDDVSFDMTNQPAGDRKSTRLNSSHTLASRMPSSA